MLLKWRLLVLLIFGVFLVSFSTSQVFAVPEAPYIYSTTYNSPAYISSTAPSFVVTSLSIGDTLKIYDNAVLYSSRVVSTAAITINFSGLAEGSHSFTANAVDSVGDSGPISNSFIFVVDLTAPNAPTLYSINGQTSSSVDSINNVTLKVTNLTTTDYLAVFDNGTMVVTDILAVGTSAVVNISAVGYGNHDYKITATDRAGNKSGFSNQLTYTMNGTNIGKLTVPRFLGNPLAEGTFMAGRYVNPHYYPRNIWDMQVFDGKIYFGSGNSANSAPDSNFGPINLWYYNLGTTSFGSDQVINQVGTTTNYADEDQVDKLRVLNGELWIPGHDSRENWSLGNIYRYNNNGIWTKFRTIPNGVHVFDAAYFNGKIYTALGLDSSDNVIYESADGGTTWTGVAHYDVIKSIRIYDLFTFNNQLYAVDYINYGTNTSTNHIFKFNGTSFVRYSMRGINLIPGGSKIVPTSENEEGFRIIRPTEFGGNLFFILANGSNDQQWAPVKLYRTSDMQNGTLINLSDGAVTYDFKVDEEKIYVLAAKKINDTSYVNYVFSSSDGINWNELLHFSYETYAISFEENNGDFYFGMGTGEPPLWSGSLADTSHLSAKSGDILKIKKEDYLIQVPGKPSQLSGLAGDGLVNLWWQVPLSDGGMPILDYKIEYKLNAGSSWSIFDDGMSVGTSATVINLIDGLGYDFRVSAINILGTGETSLTASFTPMNESVPTPTPTVFTVGSTNISDLITNNVFVPAMGTSLVDTSKITLANETFISLGIGTTINLKLNTEITRLDNQTFNANLISAESMAENEVSNFTSGFVPEAVMQWGIPGTTLVFSTPVTINMYVGSDLNGQTLNVFRSSSTSSGWTNEGIVSPGTCVVNGGYCQFSTTEASYFTLASYQTPSQPSNNSSSSNSSSSNNSSNSNSYFCNDIKPISASNLFQINVTNNTAKLFFTPLMDTNRYYVSFSTYTDAEKDGAGGDMILSKEGVQSYTVYQLKPNTVYYFKVRGQNGCTPGEWSNIMKIKTNVAKSKNVLVFYKNSYKIINSIVKSIKNIILPKTADLKTDTTITPTPWQQTVTPVPSYSSPITNTDNTNTATKKTKSKKCILWWCW